MVINQDELDRFDNESIVIPQNRGVIIGGSHPRPSQAPPKVTRVMMGVVKGDSQDQVTKKISKFLADRV